VRLWCSVESQPGERRLRARLLFSVQPMSLIDLAAIVPFYLAMLVGFDLRFLRVLRLLRIFKLTRYSSALIPAGIDQNPCAQSRMPMDMMVQG
jgi:voltage-gated potassium channel